MKAIVTCAGFLSSVQDLGRTDFRRFGVSTSGALDSFALRVANLLVGNDEGVAGRESSPGAVANLTCRLDHVHCPPGMSRICTVAKN